MVKLYPDPPTSEDLLASPNEVVHPYFLIIGVPQLGQRACEHGIPGWWGIVVPH